VQTQAQSTEKAFGNVAAAVGKLAVAFGAIQAARFVFVKTAELESQTRSLQVLTGSAEKAGQIIKDLQQLGAVTPFTSTELIDSAKRLQAFGVEADKVVETTRRLADASGATGAELSGLVTAYGQVQAKGRLQGEELLQFQERGIGLQQELRKMYGMTGEEFQKALEKGQISAKAVEVALVNLTSVGGKYANGAIAQSDTLQGRLSTLQDGIDGLARGIGTALSPAIKAVLNEAIFAINLINQLIATGARAKSFGLGDSQRKQILNQAQTEAQQIVEGRRIKDPFERNRQFQELAGQRERDLIETYGYKTGQVKPAATAPQMATQVPALLAADGGKGRKKGKTDAERAAEKAAKEAEREANRVADVVRDQQFITKQKGIQTKFAQLIFEAEQSADPIRVRQLQTVEALVLAGNETARQLEEEENSAARLAIARTRQGEAEAIRQEGLQDVLKLQIEQQKNFDEIIAGLDLELALKSATTEEAREQLRLAYELAKLQGQGFTDEQIGQITAKKTELARPKTDRERLEGAAAGVKAELDALTDPINMITNAAAGIGDAFGASFKGIISGSMTAKQALASFFTSVADQFLDMAAQIIAKMIQMFILQQALKIFGGALGGGGFTPLTNSQATDFSFNPAPMLGGANFTPFAEGGFVTGPTNALIGEGGESEYVIPASKMNAAMQRYSGGARGSAVISGSGDTSEVGGNAAPVNGGIDVRYTVERINTVDYVTASQFQAGMQQAAQQGAAQGEQRTLRRLQQSPSTRKRIGV
jgi:tape measure domain-containing protein